MEGIETITSNVVHPRVNIFAMFNYGIPTKPHRDDDAG